MKRTQALLVSAWHRFRHDWPELMLCTLVFQACLFFVLAPLGNWVLGRLIATSGGLAVSNEQIAVFFVSPLGLLAAFLIVAATAAVQFAHYAGLIWIAASDVHGGEGTAYSALRRLVSVAPRLARLAAWQAVLILAYLVPFVAAAGGLYLYATSRFDINYLLHERPPLFWWLGALVGLVGIGGALVFLALRVRWVFSMPLCLLEGVAPRAALKQSRELARGSFRRIFLLFLAWWGTASLLTVLGLALLEQIARTVLTLEGTGTGLLITMVALLVLAHLMVVALTNFVGWTGESLFALQLYREARGVPTADPVARARRSRPMPWVLVGGLLLFGGGLGRVMAELVDVQRDVAVTAHRGSSANAPENTLASVRQAIVEKAEFAEIDVQEIADGTIVVMHDTDFLRVSKVDRKTWEVDAEEIKRYDVGLWFSEKFKGERVPTLGEMIDLAKGRIRLNIEIKVHGHEKQLVRSVVRIIRAKAFASQCVISSLNAGALHEVRQLDPELRIGSIVFEAVGDLTRLDVDFLSVRMAVATPALIRRARRRDMQVHVWTVNTADDMVRFVDLRVANIITDDPVLLREVIDARDALDDQEKILLALRNWWVR